MVAVQGPNYNGPPLHSHSLNHSVIRHRISFHIFFEPNQGHDSGIEPYCFNY
jgi:hypothetical protein